MESSRIHSYTNDNIQIHANKQEIMARIEAFCSRKHQRLNERTTRHFCGSSHSLPEAMSDNHTSCARVDAVKFTRHGKSRIKISTVHNEDGPQLTCDTAVSDVKRESQHHYNAEGANMELRLDAIESHCNVQGRTDMSVVERIKSLEDRILYLEGVSPEYFNANNKPLNTRIPSFSNDQSARGTNDANTAESHKNIPSGQGELDKLTLDQIDVRIGELKQKLKIQAMAVA